MPPFHPGFGQRRPLTAIFLTTLALVLLLGAAGTAVHLATGGRPMGWGAQLAPVALAFPLVAVWVALKLGAKDMRSLLAPRTAGAALQHKASLLIVPAFALAVQAVEVAPDASVGMLRVLSCLALAALVGFVEEGIYRGLFMHWLAPRGAATAVAVSTLVFSLTHALNALGAQSLAATVLQIVFAAAFGLVAACLRLRTASLLPVMAWHAAFDTIGFLGTREHEGWLLLNCALLAGFAFWLARRNLAGRAVHLDDSAEPVRISRR